MADTVRERRCVFLAGLYRAEQEIASRLRDLAAGAPPWPEIDVERAIPWLEARGGITLAASQREALRLAAVSKALVITGGPGVGKTTLVNSILKMLVAKGVAVALCAPTGRAAKRLTESTGAEAKTIHRLLGDRPEERRLRARRRLRFFSRLAALDPITPLPEHLCVLRSGRSAQERFR